jgi:transposase
VEWRTLDAKMEALNGEFVELVCRDDAARRLTSILGVGVLNATALIAAAGNASSFGKARAVGGCHALKRWWRAMIERGVQRSAVVALANKLAPIGWAVLRKDDTFDRGHEVAA